MSKYSHLLGSSERKGHFVSQLTAEELKDLDEFVEWLKTYRTTNNTIMSDGSRGSYRTYMAQVMVVARTDGTLDETKNKSSLMSALRLFEQFKSEQDLDEEFDELEV